MAARKKKSDEVTDIDPNAPIRNPYCVGHEAAERTVLESWESGRFPHAILITGPDGIGKATLAFRIARYVLDGGRSGKHSNSATLAVSEECGTFKRIAAGGHTDLRILDRGEKTVISVDAARDVIDFARLTPAESDWRVVLVDKADHFNRNSANALLKILEEPPPNSLFILLADAPGRLLPTIRSRCRALPLKALSNEDTRDLITRYRPGTPMDEASALAVMAEGSPGRALRLLDAGGLDLYQSMVDIVSGSKQGKDSVAPIFTLADRVAGKDNQAAYEALKSMIDWWFKRIIGARARGITPPPAIEGEGEAFLALDRAGGLESWIRLWENLTAQLARAEPPSNLDKRQVVVSAFLSLRAETQ